MIRYRSGAPPARYPETPRRRARPLPAGCLAALSLCVALDGAPPAAAGERFAEDREGIVRALGGAAPDAVHAGATPKRFARKPSPVTPGPFEGIGRESEGVPRPLSSGAKTRDAAVRSVRLRVGFEHDSAALRPAARRLLEELGAALGDPRLRGSHVSIDGHTDSSGSEQHNLRLSLRRAESVRAFLVDELGLAPERLSVAGFGETRPLNDNATPLRRRSNRRVEIVRLR